MVGVVIVAHDNLAAELLSITKKIVPDLKNMAAVGIDSNAPSEINCQKISEAIQSVEHKDGVLIITDLFGGTPTNLCLSFLNNENYEVVSGVNLPMLLKIANGLGSKTLTETATFIREYGQRNIVIASQVLNGKIERTPS